MLAVLTNASFGFTDFADELKKAWQFGSLTTFGRGLPRGGEMSAVKSLERQEGILRALARRDPVVCGSSYLFSAYFSLNLIFPQWA
jgi:hypothetical protein